jgi:hypothetical protein
VTPTNVTKWVYTVVYHASPNVRALDTPFCVLALDATWNDPEPQNPLNQSCKEEVD